MYLYVFICLSMYMYDCVCVNISTFKKAYFFLFSVGTQFSSIFLLNILSLLLLINFLNIIFLALFHLPLLVFSYQYKHHSVLFYLFFIFDSPSTLFCYSICIVILYHLFHFFLPSKYHHLHCQLPSSLLPS